MIETQTLTGNIQTNELTGTLDYNTKYIQPKLNTKNINNNGIFYASDDELDGYSSVNVSVESTGVDINGQLVSKKIQSGTVSKGDFVKFGDGFIVNDRLNSINNYRFTNGTITNFENMYDDDDTNYATLTPPSGSVTTFIVQCKSNQELGIPNNAVITSAKANFKFIGNGSYNFSARGCKYLSGVVGTNTYVFDSRAYSPNNGVVLDSITAPNYTYRIGDNANTFGVQLYTSTANYGLLVYYVTFEIIYSCDNQIKKITSNADLIYGIANESGNQGDTIQVYIPNVE